jgi:hypothetical protein
MLVCIQQFNRDDQQKSCQKQPNIDREQGIQQFPEINDHKESNEKACYDQKLQDSTLFFSDERAPLFDQLQILFKLQPSP